MFLNRRDASRYRDLEASLPGLERFLKFPKLSINKTTIIDLVNKNDWKYLVVEKYMIKTHY